MGVSSCQNLPSAPLLSLFPLPWTLRSHCSVPFALSASSTPFPLDVFLPPLLCFLSSRFSTSAFLSSYLIFLGGGSGWTLALPSLPCLHISVPIAIREQSLAFGKHCSLRRSLITGSFIPALCSLSFAVQAPTWPSARHARDQKRRAVAGL